MSIFKSPDGRASLELNNTDYLDENGSKSYGFTCRVYSYGFSAEVKNIWFYKEDLLDFADKLHKLLANPTGQQVVLSAMSDFTCSVKRADSLGHFTLTTNLVSAVHQNTASLLTEVETQTLADLAEELRRTVQDA